MKNIDFKNERFDQAREAIERAVDKMVKEIENFKEKIYYHGKNCSRNSIWIQKRRIENDQYKDYTGNKINKYVIYYNYTNNIYNIRRIFEVFGTT